METELTILVARIAAVAYLAFGVAAFRGNFDVKKLMDSFEKSPGLSIFTGMFTLIMGMLLVHSHNIWVQDWPVLVTIIGWAATIKGVLFIAAPEVLKSFVPMFKKTQGVGLFVIGIGLVFGYFGFVAV
jgi:predicted MFS family arabinose efflux permease